MAFPTWQAIGAVAESLTVDISPAWPAHQAGDIGVLVVKTYSGLPRLTTPQGFQELPVSPQRINAASAREHTLTVYWKRATSGAEAAPTVKWEVDYHRAQIFTVRGCSATGRPFIDCAGKSAPSASSATFPALNTTEADSLVVDIIAHNLDSLGAQVSGWANSSLTSLTERVDDSSNTGFGGGYAIHTGQKAAAGAVNATTANLAATALQAMISIAFTAVDQPVDKMPYLKAYGTSVESASANVSPAWPAHVAGDVGMLIVESGGWPVTLGTPAGFTEVPDSPQNANISGATAATHLSVYLCRATSGAMGNPTVNFVADHIRAVIVTFGNVISAGDPWDVTSGSTTGGGATSTSYSVPGDTSTVPNCLVVALGSNSRDIGTKNEWSGWTNADLRYLTEKLDDNSTIGNGSGFGFATGEKVTPGAFGATTATLLFASHQGRIMVALKGATGGDLVAEKVVINTSVKAANLFHDRVIAADPLVVATTVKDADFPIVQTYVLNAEPVVINTQVFGVLLTKSSRGWRKQQERTPTVWTKQSQLDLEN